MGNRGPSNLVDAGGDRATHKEDLEVSLSAHETHEEDLEVD